MAFLVSAVGQDALAEVASWSDVRSLAAATRLRKRFPPELAAAVLSQVELRSKARTKFGELAELLLFTPAGLEQATRASVASYRAGLIKGAGFSRVVDLGCGLGADSLALVRAGVDVVAVEADPVTAGFARHNLAVAGESGLDEPGLGGSGTAEVVVGDAVELAPQLLGDGDFVFADPARRSGGNRTWQVEDFSPGWRFIEALFERPAWVKLGPGMPHRLIPPEVSARWISDGGDLVETALTTGLHAPGERCAVLLAGPHELAAGIRAEVLDRPIEAGEVLYEPDPAVIRSGAVGPLAARLGARQVTDQIPYLVAREAVATPFGRAFAVVEAMPWKEKTLKAWCREHAIGVLEIKKRGIELDPAALRRRLKLNGQASATVVLTPTGDGAQLLIVERLPA